MLRTAFLVVLVVFLSAFQLPAEASSTGDTNGDGYVNTADIFYFINYLYAGGPAPAPQTQRNIISITLDESLNYGFGNKFFVHLPQGAVITDARFTFQVVSYLYDPNRCENSSFIIEFHSLGFTGSSSPETWASEKVDFYTPPSFGDSPLVHHINFDAIVPVDNDNFTYEVWVENAGPCGSVSPRVLTIEFGW